MMTMVKADTISVPPTRYSPRVKFPPAPFVEPTMYGPAKPPRVPSELISPIDAAAAVPAKKGVGRHQSGGFAALTPNAVSESPATARKAEDPPRAATAIPAAPIRQAVAACQ